MGAMDYQLGFKDESTFNTPVTVDRFAEYAGDQAPIMGIAGRTEGNPLRVGSRARRAGRTIPYFHHAEGTVEMELLTKGFGWWLKHMLPSVATTGAGPYVHTATEGGSSASIGKSFTAQMNYPFNPAGTNQAVTFAGGKIPKWSLGCDVDGMLTVSLDLWFASMTTATALATAAYPSAPNNFAWSHGVVTVGGTAFDITNLNVEVDQGMNVDRRQIRGNSAAKEPTPGALGVTWGLTADFDSLTQWNRVHSTSVSGMSAAIVSTFTNGADIIVVNIPAGRFDKIALKDDTGLSQELTGVGEYDGTNSPITVVYTSGDAIA